MKTKEKKYILLSAASVTCFMLIWYLCSDVFKLVSGLIIPGPLRVVESFIFKLTSARPDGGTLFQHIWASLQVALMGFGLGVMIGVPLGIAMAWFENFDMIFKPVFDLIRPIPPVAWIPLMIVWLGIGILPKAVIIFFSAFIPCVINSYAGIKQTSMVHIWVAKTFGAKRGVILRKVALPTALPFIFTGMRISLGFSWTSLVAAEMLASVAGLGYMIQVSRMLARSDLIIVGMLTIGGIGALLAWLLSLLEKRFIKG
jgi:NitT/TauT family transport system permease protein/taurine transport system permease protein